MKRNKLFKTIITILLLIIVSIVGFVVSINDKVEENNKIQIAVTIVPQKTFVEAVAGDLVDVVVMVPPGASPANYEPTPQEIANFSDSKIYFSIGVPTEATNIMPSALEVDGLKIVKTNEEVAKVYAERTFATGKRDQHIWLSPKRVMVMIDVIKNELVALDPNNASIYNDNAQSYISKLLLLDSEIKSSLEGIESNKIIVFHPAFGYLTDDYGLEMYALEEDGSEATAERLMEMIDFSKEHGIKAIFYQAEISSLQAASFAEEIGGKTVMLAPLSPNYIENLKNMAILIKEVNNE
jgi:zinc transport system substrate-binding protein